MKPDRDLINRLHDIDNRIIYSDLALFDESNVEKYKLALEEYMHRLYGNSNSELVLRGISVYLADSGSLPCAKRSPLKNIITCLMDGTEKGVNESFGTSCHIFDYTYLWYARESAKEFRTIFPDHKDIIFPAILVYYRNLLVHKFPQLGVPEDINLRNQCIHKLIISDI